MSVFSQMLLLTVSWFWPIKHKSISQCIWETYRLNRFSSSVQPWFILITTATKSLKCIKIMVVQCACCFLIGYGYRAFITRILQLPFILQDKKPGPMHRLWTALSSFVCVCMISGQLQKIVVLLGCSCSMSYLYRFHWFFKGEMTRTFSIFCWRLLTCWLRELLWKVLLLFS